MEEQIRHVPSLFSFKIMSTKRPLSREEGRTLRESLHQLARVQRRVLNPLLVNLVIV